MNGSISLLRANTALTTNVKIVVDSNYNLYLESYSANLELSNKRFKKYLINSEVFISERIASFYKDLPSDIAFDVKNDIKSDAIQNTYENQYDDIYYSGARAVEDTRYIEEFQYNTTLKINPNKLPRHFFIFRVDDPGIYTLDNTNIQDFFNDFKVVANFDLSTKTSIGKLWNKNYIEDDTIPRSPIEFNFKNFEFSQWKGYDYRTGGSVSKSFFISEYIQNQNTDFNIEEYITSGFQKNGVIAANYSNISYLYDDTVSGVFYKSNGGINKYYEDEYPLIHKLIKSGYIEDGQYIKTVDGTRIKYEFNEHVPYRKKWTINRYCGFYANELKSITKVSPYLTVSFNVGAGITIVDNVFKQGGNNINPVLGAYNNQLPVYFKIDNQFYLVEENTNGEFLIITQEKINGTLDDFVSGAQKSIKLEYETDGATDYNTYIKNVDNTYYYNIEMDYYLDNKSIVMVKILDKYYKIKKDIQGYFLNTDEYITCDSNILIKQLGNNARTIDSMQILTKDNNIIYFEFFVFKFTDIADWDYDRVDTKFANIEYDKNDSISYNRPFVYMTDINDVAVPKDPYNEKYYNIWLQNTNTMLNTQITPAQYILPLASEYAASGDLYMFNDANTLTSIWDINQSINKWGLLDSINTNAYPYKINNSLVVAGTFNFTPNMYNTNVSINDMNLDWFYSLGKPINHDLGDFDNTLLDYTNTRLNNTIHRTLNLDLLDLNSGSYNIENIYKIDLDYYKDPNAVINYFEYIFNTPTMYNDQLSNNLIKHNRVSYLQESDNVNGPAVFFKGFKAYLQWVDLENPNIVNKFKTVPANDLSGYSFAILFSPRYTENTNLHGKPGIEIILNNKYKNILINIYIYTPQGAFTSLDYRERDNLYTENIIKYSKYDSFSGNTDWVDSQLTVQALTLANIVNLLNKNKLDDNVFTDGIKYTIVDDKKYYPISNITTDVTGTIVTMTFVNDVPFKHGEWIYFENTGFDEFDKNIQIVNKIGNKTVVLNFDTDQSASVATILGFISDILITSEQEVLPFRFKIIEPDEIKINTDVNILVGDTSCPVTPTNSFKINKDIIVYDNSIDGLIPHVYVDDNISRRIYKQNLNNELSFSELDKLPSIYRFSGDYEPILSNIDLFNNSTLDKYLSPTAKYMTFDGVRLELHFDIPASNKMSVGDIFYIPNIDDYTFLQYRTGHIIKIGTSTYFPSGYKISLNFDWYTAPIISNLDLVALGTTFDIYLFKNLESNITFEFDYQYFGINKNVINAKVYDTVNPLQTSNNINKVTNQYPMIDEHGVMTIDRNIFKSSWDLEYYYKTLINKYDKI